MRARVGDLGIARFDPDEDDIKAGRKWNEYVCIVIGIEECYQSCKCRPKQIPDYKFIWWDGTGRDFKITRGNLPRNRLVRARPINDDWEGTLESLTIDKVEPVIKA